MPEGFHSGGKLYLMCRRLLHVLSSASVCHVCQSVSPFLPERDYVTFRYMLSHIRLSSVCLPSVTFVRPTQPVEIFRNVLRNFAP